MQWSVDCPLCIAQKKNKLPSCHPAMIYFYREHLLERANTPLHPQLRSIIRLYRNSRSSQRFFTFRSFTVMRNGNGKRLSLDINDSKRYFYNGRIRVNYYSAFLTFEVLSLFFTAIFIVIVFVSTILGKGDIVNYVVATVNFYVQCSTFLTRPRMIIIFKFVKIDS